MIGDYLNNNLKSYSRNVEFVSMPASIKRRIITYNLKYQGYLDLLSNKKFPRHFAFLQFISSYVETDFYRKYFFHQISRIKLKLIVKRHFGSQLAKYIQKT